MTNTIQQRYSGGQSRIDQQNHKTKKEAVENLYFLTYFFVYTCHYTEYDTQPYRMYQIFTINNNNDNCM